jgi:membrane protein YdbS with pleckstrin-like domain
MMSGVDVKVIKPPIESIRSGSIFSPSKKYIQKLWLKLIESAFLIWIGCIAGTWCIARFLSIVEPKKYVFDKILETWLSPVTLWGLMLNILWLLPALIFIPRYVATIEYSVRAESGEAMPEIYVKKGLFTVTVKHVPFRTITNIASKSGVLDRLFGIGSVHIETAGNSPEERGPEEILEGIVFYEEVRDYILAELRKFRSPYVIGTEVCYPDDVVRSHVTDTNKEILETLKQIKELFEKSEKE